jgi:hypothetical protein
MKTSGLAMTLEAPAQAQLEKVALRVAAAIRGYGRRPFVAREGIER